MDYDIIYTDDERNADRRRPGRRPGRAVYVPQGARPTVITGGGSGNWFRPQVPQHMQHYQQPNSVASRFGMSTGELIDTGIQLLAAITPLPAAPVSQGDSSVDIDNLMTYQGALWQHAKRDEQLRTLGGLLVRILK